MCLGVVDVNTLKSGHSVPAIEGGQEGRTTDTTGSFVLPDAVRCPSEQNSRPWLGGHSSRKGLFHDIVFLLHGYCAVVEQVAVAAGVYRTLGVEELDMTLEFLTFPEALDQIVEYGLFFRGKPGGISRIYRGNWRWRPLLRNRQGSWSAEYRHSWKRC